MLLSEDFCKMIKKEEVYDYTKALQEKELFHVGYGVDDNYVRCMAASIVSLCENNKDVSLIFHVIASGLQPETKLKIEKLAKTFSITLHLYELDVKDFVGLPQQVHFPLSIYYRYILPLVLQNVDRILYLDADIINIRSLCGFLDLPMNDTVVAAVPDVEWMGKKRNKALGLTNHRYFNSGVLWIDIKKWNALHVFEQTIAVLQQNPNLFRYPDQDALNLILTGKVHYMDRTYNCIDSAAADSMEIVLLHFAAHPKPWNIAWPISKLCTDFTRDIYRQYEAMTPWRDTELQMPRNYKEMKVYAKCLWHNGSYLASSFWKIKYMMKKIFH